MILNDSTKLDNILGNTYALEEEVSILNMDSIPGVECCGSEENKQMLLTKIASDFFVLEEDREDSYAQMMVVNPKLYQADIDEEEDGLSISIYGHSNFEITLTVRDQKVEAEYTVRGKYVGYKLFKEEEFTYQIYRAPINVEKFVLHSKDWKKNQLIYGYCELVVDPYYVNVGASKPLHLQRSFKLYFKAKAP